MIEKCRTCNGDLSFDKISKCKRCRVCHPIEPPTRPEISLSLINLEYCETRHEREVRIDDVAKRMGWNPEKYIENENQRRYGA